MSKDDFKLFLAFVLIVLGIAVAGWFDFHVWRIVHPNAPAWTFFFS